MKESSIRQPFLETGDFARRNWFERTFSRMGPGSLRGSVITLSSGAIADGLLSLPYAFSRCGLAIGVALMIFTALRADLNF